MLGRCAAGIAVVVTMGAIAGCAPNIESMLRGSLADNVEDAQDTLWDYREQIVFDPEAAIAELDFIGDARLAPDADGRQYTLTALDDAADEVTLTLVLTGGATTGGGLFYQHVEGVTCADFVFPRGAEEIRVEDAACAEAPKVDGGPLVIPFSELQVRETVTVADYPPPICQCYSGSECDCPGG